MSITELEFERDPTLQLTRRYDKINPELEGFESYNNRRGILSSEANRRLREEAKLKSLDPSGFYNGT